MSGSSLHKFTVVLVVLGCLGLVLLIITVVLVIVRCCGAAVLQCCSAAVLLYKLVLQKFHPKVRNHGEGPY